jgi:hypothetical protein
VRTESELKSLFYQAYDNARISGFLARVAALSETERRNLPGFLGEGSHFQSFEVAATPIHLAVSIAKGSFHKLGDAALRRWSEAMTLAKSLEQAVLVPPMDILQQHGLMAIVMPKGQVVSRQGAKAVNTLLHETAKALGQAGLVLDDYPQIREAEGVPFIVDWSDLTFVRPAYR